MPTYDDDEASTQDGQPREGFEFVLPAVTYRLTSGDRDLVIDGNTYRKSPVARGDLEVSATTAAQELEITLPISHPIAQRYALGGVPPRTIVVTVRRKMLRSGASEVIWTGDVVSMAVDKHLAKFLVPSRLGQAMVRRLPTITAGRACPHVLYDSNCRAVRTSFRIQAQVISKDGPFVVVSTVGGNPDQWFKFGELFHPSSNERMTIFDQTGTTLTLQLPIAELQANDFVDLFAGCDHTFPTCTTKFNNLLNYGGFPSLPRTNPFLISGFGIYRSES